MDKPTNCETLKSIIESETVEVPIGELIKIKETVEEIVSGLHKFKPSIFGYKMCGSYGLYNGIISDLNFVIDRWLSEKLRAVELSENHKLVIKEMIEKVQK